MILQAAFLDVFHGDCAVITFEDRGQTRCIVVDGGETKEAAFRLNAWLRHQGVRVIDLLVATHIDADHVNGLVHLLASYSQDEDHWNGGQPACIRHYWGPLPDPLWQPPVRSPGPSGWDPLDLPEVSFIAESVSQNQSLARLVREHMAEAAALVHPSLAEPPSGPLFDSVALDLLSPDRQVPDTVVGRVPFRWSDAVGLVAASGAPLPEDPARLEELARAGTLFAAAMADRDANNQSIVFRLRPADTGSPAWSFLFTGDAQQEAWEMMLQEHPAERLAARVLKAPHHGSYRNGITPEALAVVTPQVAVISAGQKHGLPDAEMLNLLRGSGEGLLFCTERNNDRRHRGPCGQKALCPRRTKRQFRSLLL
ncbi:MAG: MBL fold metallo-hydrolase, partial [Chloroflexi bacterium]|nr:MBL fold metallo-hydrolase [Chloroflexota bacterium]